MAPLKNHACLVTGHDADAPAEASKALGCEAALSTLDTLDEVLDTFQVLIFRLAESFCIVVQRGLSLISMRSLCDAAALDHKFGAVAARQAGAKANATQAVCVDSLGYARSVRGAANGARGRQHLYVAQGAPEVRCLHSGTPLLSKPPHELLHATT